MFRTNGKIIRRQRVSWKDAVRLIVCRWLRVLRIGGAGKKRAGLAILGGILPADGRNPDRSVGTRLHARGRLAD